MVNDEEFVLSFTQTCRETLAMRTFQPSERRKLGRCSNNWTSPPDLEFTDYSLDKITGLHLIARVANDYPATKFILASGDLEEATQAVGNPLRSG